MEAIIRFFEFFGQLLWAFVCDAWYALFKREKKSVLNQVVVITGSAGGIGSQVAAKFAAQGAKLALLDMSKEANEKLATNLREQGSVAVAFQCDVTKPDELRRVAMEIQEHEELGDPDIVLCNAGVLTAKLLMDLADAEIRKTFDINILGYFWTIRAFLPRMLERNSGHLAAISSIGGHFGQSFSTDYSASKFAVRGLMESLEWELDDLGKTGIKTTIIYPFFTYTPLLNVCHVESKIFSLLTPEETSQAILDGILYEDYEKYIPRMLSVFCQFVKPMMSTHSRHVFRKYVDITYNRIHESIANGVAFAINNNGKI
jgi:all-trans-retinol dehydrogenase (NAD+)